MLKKKDKMQIYHDPITQTEPEGMATLVAEYRPDHGDGLSMWVVIFDDEPLSEYTRTIKE